MDFTRRSRKRYASRKFFKSSSGQMHHPDLKEALQWKPGAPSLSGRAANAEINTILHELDLSFAEFMGLPSVPCLLTYAKNASRTVGLQISRLEALLRFLRYFDLNAVLDARRDLRGNPRMAGPLGYLLKVFLTNPFTFYSRMKKLRKSLIWGNLQAYGSLVPSFSCFLKAERTSLDGVSALRDAGFASVEEDPSGLLMRAFTLYKAAADLTNELKTPLNRDPTVLRELRHELAFMATLSLSFHEQMLFQASECYGDSEIQRMTGGMTKTLYIEDPVDLVMLLPDGGNWACFTDRMGLDEMESSMGAYVSIKDPEGNLRHYKLKDEQTKRKGTIFDYLSNRFEGDSAAKLIASPSLPLPKYDDGEASGFSRIYQTYLRAKGKYQHP